MNLQRRDPALADIIDYLEFGQLPLDGKDPKTKLHIIEQHYLDPDCLLYHILYQMVDTCRHHSQSKWYLFRFVS